MARNEYNTGNDSVKLLCWLVWCNLCVKLLWWLACGGLCVKLLCWLAFSENLWPKSQTSLNPVIQRLAMLLLQWWAASWTPAGRRGRHGSSSGCRAAVGQRLEARDRGSVLCVSVANWCCWSDWMWCDCGVLGTSWDICVCAWASVTGLRLLCVRALSLSSLSCNVCCGL